MECERSNFSQKVPLLLQQCFIFKHNNFCVVGKSTFHTGRPRVERRTRTHRLRKPNNLTALSRSCLVKGLLQIPFLPNCSCGGSFHVLFFVFTLRSSGAPDVNNGTSLKLVLKKPKDTTTTIAHSAPHDSTLVNSPHCTCQIAHPSIAEIAFPPPTIALVNPQKQISSTSQH